MKIKTLFKVVSGLAICSSLVPFSVAYSNTHTHTHNSLNVGNSNQNDGIEWDITDDGVLSPKEGTTIPRNLVIPKSVTNSSGNPIKVAKIKDSAFDSNDQIQSLSFEDLDNDQQISIGNSSFVGCENLSSVDIKANVISIDNTSFAACPSLNHIWISDDNTQFALKSFDHGGYIYQKNGDQYKAIGGLAYGDIDLAEATHIENGAFALCSSINSFHISNSLTSVADGAFRGCYFKNITMDENNNFKWVNKTTKGGWIVKKDQVDKYSCPTGLAYGEIDINNVGSIADGAFYNCYALTSVNIKDGVSTIGNGAFSECDSLVSVNILNSVINIGQGAFSGCDKLASVLLPDSLQNIGEIVFARCFSLTSINIPNTVISIGYNAFFLCNLLTKVTTSWTVEELKKLTLGNLIFYRVANITINAKNPDGHSHDELFNKYQEIFTTQSTGARTISIHVDPDLQPDVFWNIDENGVISHKENVDIPVELHIPKEVVNNNRVKTIVKKIKDSAFADNSTITSLVFDDLDENQNIEIGANAFSNCSKLTNINIPKNVNKIGYSAFFHSFNITSIALVDNPVYALKTFGNNGAYVYEKSGNQFAAVGSLAYGEIDLTGATAINMAAFVGTNISSLIIPNTVTSIGASAFGECQNLVNITTSWTVEELKSLNLGLTIFSNISKIVINAKNPDGHSHDELLKKYQEIFTTEKTGVSKITINVDSDLQPEPITQNFNWAILLGSIFSVIFVSGLAATFGIYLKENKNKESK